MTSPKAKKTAYLLSQYPAVSHTFFMTEILALRKLGFTILTASINGVSPPEDGFPETETQEWRNTFYIKSMPRTRLLKLLIKVGFGHPIIAFRGLRAALALRPFSLYLIFYWLESLLLGQWMRDSDCTHLHVHFAGPVATVGLLTSIGWKVPFSLSVHGPDDFYNVEKYHLQRKIEHASFVCCISFFCRSQLLRLIPGTEWDKFYVCRLGVDTESFAPTPAIARDIPRIASIGRLHPSKGQAILLKAIALLRARGVAVKLDLVGGGSERPFLERLIRENDLSDSVTMHGALSHERTRAILQGADLFVLSSFAEGVPVALMEAMASGKPSICTTIAGVPELITKATEGRLVPPADEQSLALAIMDLVGDASLRSLLSQGGRAKVIADYNIDTNVKRLAQVFQQNHLGGGFGEQTLDSIRSTGPAGPFGPDRLFQHGKGPA